MFALPGCQRISLNTVLCDTLGLADNRCTKPSHSQSLANFVANFQSFSAARTIFFHNFIRKSIRIRYRIPSQRLIRSFFFEIWWRKFASANFRGASEFAFAFAAVSLRPRFTQRLTIDAQNLPTRFVVFLPNVCGSVAATLPRSPPLNKGIVVCRATPGHYTPAPREGLIAHSAK